MQIHRLTWPCGLVLAVCLYLSLTACDEVPNRTSVPYPIPQDTPATTVRTTYLSAAKLQMALPRVRRESKFRWLTHSTRVPGHLGAQLLHKETKRVVLLFTVDDLIDRPDRLARLKALKTTVGKRPGEVRKDAWVRALVGERFEVVLRAQSPDFYNHTRLEHWWNEMRLRDLEKLAK